MFILSVLKGIFELACGLTHASIFFRGCANFYPEYSIEIRYALKAGTKCDFGYSESWICEQLQSQTDSLLCQIIAEGYPQGLLEKS